MFIAMKTLNTPKNPTEKWEWIKFQLRIKGSSLSALARELNVDRSAVQNTKRLPYPRMERAIAAKLDMSPWQLWPERWNKDGSPRRQRPRASEVKAVNTNSNAGGLTTHCQRAAGV